MSRICPNPECSTREVKDNETFCPECGTIPEIEDESKKNRKSALDNDIYDYLIKKFEEVHAVGYNNTKSIDIYDDRDPSDKKIYSKWVKESTCLVLKDDKPYLSVEMMPSFNTSPITVAGNVLIHAIADSAIVKFLGRRTDVKYIFESNEFPRYLLIVIPDPDEDTETSKEEQMILIEQLIKELEFLKKSSLKNFKICFASQFKSSLEKLFTDE